MAYFVQTTTRTTFLERALMSGAALLDKMAARQAKLRVYRTTFGELSALSNRELADLGIHRSEIRGLALEAAESRR